MNASLWFKSLSRIRKSISNHADIRLAIYAVAEQDAQYRRDQALNEPLPKVVPSDLSKPDLLGWLITTCDPKLVDALELATEGRLKRHSALREVMFEAARLSVVHRAAARGEQPS